MKPRKFVSFKNENHKLTLWIYRACYDFHINHFGNSIKIFWKWLLLLTMSLIVRLDTVQMKKFWGIFIEPVIFEYCTELSSQLFSAHNILSQPKDFWQVGSFNFFDELNNFGIDCHLPVNIFYTLIIYWTRV